MNDIRHLALLAVVIGLSGYNVKTAAQTPFDKVEVEKRIEKLLTPQIKKMPRSQATAKVTDCRMNANSSETSRRHLPRNCPKPTGNTTSTSSPAEMTSKRWLKTLTALPETISGRASTIRESPG